MSKRKEVGLFVFVLVIGIIVSYYLAVNNSTNSTISGRVADAVNDPCYWPADPSVQTTGQAKSGNLLNITYAGSNYIEERILCYNGRWYTSVDDWQNWNYATNPSWGYKTATTTAQAQTYGISGWEIVYDAGWGSKIWKKISTTPVVSGSATGECYWLPANYNSATGNWEKSTSSPDKAANNSLLYYTSNSELGPYYVNELLCVDGRWYASEKVSWLPDYLMYSNERTGEIYPDRAEWGYIIADLDDQIGEWKVQNVNGANVWGKVINVGPPTLPTSICTELDQNDVPKNYDHRGVNKVGINAYPDSCDPQNSSLLVEYYCEDGAIKSLNNYCELGCYQGRCLQINEDKVAVGENIVYNGDFSMPREESVFSGDYEIFSGDWVYHSGDNAEGATTDRIFLGTFEGSGIQPYLNIIGFGFAEQLVYLEKGKTYNFSLNMFSSYAQGMKPIAVVKSYETGEAAFWPILSSDEDGWIEDAIYPTGIHSVTFAIQKNGYYVVQVGTDPTHSGEAYETFFDNVKLVEIETSGEPVECDEGFVLVNGECVEIPDNTNVFSCPAFVQGGNPLSGKTRAQNQSGIYYCDPMDLDYKLTKENGQSCISDYQCTSNVCIDGQCTSIREELEEQTGVLRKIFCAIVNPVDVLKRNQAGETASNNDYLACVAQGSEAE